MHSVCGWALLATAVGPDLRGHETSREEREQKHSLRRVSNCRWPALPHQASWARCRGLLTIGGAPLAANNLLTLITVAACQGRLAVHRVIARLAWQRARVWVLTLFASDNLRAHRISAACQRRLSIDGVIARLARGCARGRPPALLASDPPPCPLTR